MIFLGNKQFYFQSKIDERKMFISEDIGIKNPKLLKTDLSRRSKYFFNL